MKRKLFIVFLILLAVSCAAAMFLLAGVSATEEAPYLFIANQSMSLDDNIYIYFRAYYDGIDTSSDEYGMIIWKNIREDGVYTYENAAKDGTSIIMKGTDTWLKDPSSGKDLGSFSYKISAKEMADVVFAQAYAKKGGKYYYSTISAYSATTYAARMLGLVEGISGTSDPKLKTLMNDMMAYGASAQKYFNYHTDNLATDAICHRTTYMVLFRDYDGTPLKTVLEVPKGGSATPPPDPVREGYVFTGWSRSFDNITGHTAITATYEKSHEHSFSAWQPLNETSHQRSCACGATETAAHTFDANDQCTACGYVKSYTVTFKDHDGTVLKTQTVKSGESATAPADPIREGYTFTGWDKAFDKITGNTVVTATYKVAEQYDVKFSFDGAPVKAGEELALTLSVASKETAAVNGLVIYNLTYDKTALELVGYESYGTLVTDSTAGASSIIPTSVAPVTLGYTSPIVASGDICVLRFKVKGTVAAGTQLTVSASASASKGGVPLTTIIAPSYTFTVTA